MREDNAAGWLAGLGHDTVSWTELGGDVSPRRYARARSRSGESFLVARYPEELAGAFERFLTTTALLTGAGVRVPEVLAVDRERRYMLLEDLGERTLYELAPAPWEELAPCFESALQARRRLAAVPREAVAGLNPPLDFELLRRELDATWEVLLEPRGLTGDAPTRRDLRRGLEALCAALAADDPVPCHRDFMARNLIPLATAPAGTAAAVGVIDHQDLRLGPPFYDLASLLNDSLFPPPRLEETLLAKELTSAAERQAYGRAVAQRALKAAGTFAAFARRGNPRHLCLIPPSLERAARHLRRLPETAAVAVKLSTRWRQVVC